MDLGAVWTETKAELTVAGSDLVGFAIGVVEALVVVLVAAIVARFLRRRIRRVLVRAKVDGNVGALAANAVTIGTYVAAAAFVLALLGANWTALGAILGAGTVALSLALQDVLRNFVAGLYILLERPFAIGDRIKVRDVEGEVASIDIRTTMLHAEGGERFLVPNATLFAEVLTNRSARGLARTTVTLQHLGTPLVEIPTAVAAAVAGIEGVGGAAPTVEIGGAGVDGAEVVLHLPHAAGVDVTPVVVARLRERFPEANVVIGRP